MPSLQNALLVTADTRLSLSLLQTFNRYLYTEDGGSTFLRNVSETVPNYTALHPRICPVTGTL
jgi:hypothetical protein